MTEQQRRRHRALVIHVDGQYQAWCKTCRWESPPTSFQPLARRAADQHDTEQQEVAQ